jgi:hypothetical protein
VNSGIPPLPPPNNARSQYSRSQYRDKRIAGCEDHSRLSE